MNKIKVIDCVPGLRQHMEDIVTSLRRLLNDEYDLVHEDWRSVLHRVDASVRAQAHLRLLKELVAQAADFTSAKKKEMRRGLLGKDKYERR